MASNKRRILTIDDEPDERIYLAALLEDNGFTADTAKDGNEALEKARASPPDLITLDITMPEKSGVTFYQEIRKDPKLGKIPIIIVTGVTGLDGDPEEFRQFISTRKDTPPPEGFVTKPVDQEKFLEKVAELLR